MGVGMSRGLAVSGETEHSGRFMESYSDYRVVFHKAKPLAPICAFLGPYRDLLAAVRYSSSSTETPAGDRLVLSRNILVDGAPSLQIGQLGLMPTKPFPLRAVGDSVGEHQMNIGLVHAVTLAKSPSPPITVGIRWTNQIVATMQSSCRFDNKEGRRESVQLHRPQHRPRCLIQAEVPPGLGLTLITADMRWPRPGRRSPKTSAPEDGHGLMHGCTMLQLLFPAMFEPLTPNVLEGATRSTGEDVGCQMLIRRSSLVGTIRLPSGRVPCARPILAGRLREKARDASRAPHWPKGGNPYSLLASLGRLSV
ncbi:hypothetical protein An01g08770 [Aspergillus niger]|uniref:Uncharacterized protein n=3 Tax=Aspergillus TaxID=5052 RepID=A2Q9R0_ASPNC|nr:hypothetical protein An01g08770 [Aspergillus niger]CAK37122.1 hypothetical protein An01g08770 [Aspergillus niger]